MNSIKRFEPIFGEWYVDEKIGEGSFGKVYRIRREEFGKVYYAALKYIQMPDSDDDIHQLMQEGMDAQSIHTYYEQLVHGLSDEISIMNVLKGNTNIVSYEHSRITPRADGMGYDIFIRMELLQSLNTYLRSHTLSRNDIIKLGIDICNALETCSRHNIIHRDIKPDNIFVNNDGNYKLGDFGIARVLNEAGISMSKKGTYNYMAPEVYRGENYSASVDLYSLGLVMYRLSNGGRSPFLPQFPSPIAPGDRDNALIRRMGGEQIPLPCGVDVELGRVILTACEYNPMNRFQTPAQMRAALESVAALNYQPSPLGYDQSDIDNYYKTPAGVYDTYEPDNTYLLFDNDMQYNNCAAQNAYDDMTYVLSEQQNMDVTPPISDLQNNKPAVENTKKPLPLPAIIGISAALVIIIVVSFLLFVPLKKAYVINENGEVEEINRPLFGGKVKDELEDIDMEEYHKGYVTITQSDGIEKIVPIASPKEEAKKEAKNSATPKPTKTPKPTSTPKSTKQPTPTPQPTQAPTKIQPTQQPSRTQQPAETPPSGKLYSKPTDDYTGYEIKHYYEYKKIIPNNWQIISTGGNALTNLDEALAYVKNLPDSKDKYCKITIKDDNVKIEIANGHSTELVDELPEEPDTSTIEELYYNGELKKLYVENSIKEYWIYEKI